MKKVINVLLSVGVSIALIASSCSKQDNKLHNGDILFFGIPSDYSLDTNSIADAIKDATGNDTLNLIHAGIIEVKGDSVFVIDATIKHGVDRHPLDTTLKDFKLRDGSYPTFIVKRLPDTCDVNAAVERAKTFCGRGYDVHFLPDNDALYCTELIQFSYLDSKGNKIFKSNPMNFKAKDGEFPIYWVQLFGLLGEPIPQGQPGTNPQDMCKEPVLSYAGNLEVGKELTLRKEADL